MLGDRYQLHDLVQLDASTAGVIVGVEAGGIARVLTNQGAPGAPDVRRVRAADIARKVNAARATAVDKHGAAISAGEAVEVVDGELRGRKGVAHAVARGHVFVRLSGAAPDKSLGGFACVRAQACVTRAGAVPRTPAHPLMVRGQGNGGDRER